MAILFECTVYSLIITNSALSLLLDNVMFGNKDRMGRIYSSL